MWLSMILALALGQNDPFQQDIAAFKALDAKSRPGKGQILFIGSSSFTRWDGVQNAFPKHKILNRAFGGSCLMDIIAHLDDVVFRYEPKQVVLYCGENDFATDATVTPDVVVERFKHLYTRVRTKLPDSFFVYVSMKPSPSRWELAPKFREANVAIRSFLSDEKRAAFVDLWPVMIGQDGKPKPELFVEDELHVNEKGYQLWTPLLEKVLIRD